MSKEFTLSKIGDILANDDLAATQLGNYLIANLLLEQKSNGRVDMEGGDKTPAGLARTVIHLLEEFDLKDPDIVPINIVQNPSVREVVLAVLKERALTGEQLNKNVRLYCQGVDHEDIGKIIWQMINKCEIEPDRNWVFKLVDPATVVNA